MTGALRGGGSGVPHFADAVGWDGSSTVLSLFAIGGSRTTLDLPTPLTRPEKTTYFPLEEDDEPVLGGRTCLEVDLTYLTVPRDVDQILRWALESFLANGADVAWAAFEGSFSFDDLLTPAVAEQVYAVADRNGVELATSDDTRRSATWVDRLHQARRLLLSR